MKKSDLIIEELLFLCLLKGVSEQSTYLINEFRQYKKKDFNALVKHVDSFIKEWEATQSEEGKAFIQAVTDVYHNITIDIRKGAKEKYEQQEKQSAA